MAGNGWYNFQVAMRKTVLIFLFLFTLVSSANAGLLSGSASGFVEKKGASLVGLGIATTMFETPVTSMNIFGKYGVSEKGNVFGKIAVGNINYSTISGFNLTRNPFIYSIGGEYAFLKVPDSSDYYNLVIEYEGASWGVNDLNNTSSSVTLGASLIKKLSNLRKQKITVAAFFFNAGENAGAKITSSTKYGIMMEDKHKFTDLVEGYLEGGVFFGDESGILVYFGSGIDFSFGG